jgi:LPXTG-motif cell wall-anchored protein
MRRLLALPGAVMALFALLLVAPPGAQADDYVPTVPTGCHLSVPATVVGDHVVVRVRISAASGTPTGEVTVTIPRKPDAWSVTARYEGTPLRLVGPKLPKGDHVAQVVFTPDDQRFAGCRDRAPFQDGGAGGDHGGTGGENLPNTGGPHLMWLVAGAGLLLTGGGLVERGRRKA